MPAPGHLSQVWQAPADEAPLLCARGVERRVGEGNVTHRLVAQPSSIGGGREPGRQGRATKAPAKLLLPATPERDCPRQQRRLPVRAREWYLDPRRHARTRGQEEALDRFVVGGPVRCTARHRERLARRSPHDPYRADADREDGRRRQAPAPDVLARGPWIERTPAPIPSQTPERTTTGGRLTEERAYQQGSRQQHRVALDVAPHRRAHEKTQQTRKQVDERAVAKQPLCRGQRPEEGGYDEHRRRERPDRVRLVAALGEQQQQW